jgi:hypothetical protein
MICDAISSHDATSSRSSDFLLTLQSAFYIAGTVRCTGIARDSFGCADHPEPAVVAVHSSPRSAE